MAHEQRLRHPVRAACCWPWAWAWVWPVWPTADRSHQREQFRQMDAARQGRR